MTERNCGSCAAWNDGICHLAPPTPILFGMQQQKQNVLTKQPLLPPQPVFIFARPSVAATDFCMMHSPKE